MTSSWESVDPFRLLVDTNAELVMNLRTRTPLTRVVVGAPLLALMRLYMDRNGFFRSKALSGDVLSVNVFYSRRLLKRGKYVDTVDYVQWRKQQILTCAQFANY